jgi:hypothetical protein
MTTTPNTRRCNLCNPATLVTNGVDSRGWTRMLCGTCYRFYGFKPPADAAKSKSFKETSEQ